MVNVSKALDIDKIMEYSSFDESSQRTIVASDGFESYDDIFTLEGSYILNVAKGFSESTVAAGRSALACVIPIFWKQLFIGPKTSGRSVGQLPLLASAMLPNSELQLKRQDIGPGSVSTA